jgi:RND family efflux transporter MFP subunit
MNPDISTRKRRSLYLLPIPVLLIASGLTLHFYRLHQADDSPPPEHAPWAVQTGFVERGSVSVGIETVATLVAPQEIVLSPQIQGAVMAVGPRAGVPVKRGELLVRIDARNISASVAALEQQRAAVLADAEYADKQLRRIDAVLSEGGVSQAQADQSRAAAQATRARSRSLDNQIAALRVQLGYAEIRAPVDSLVALRMVEVGDIVGPGRPVYRLTAGAGAVVTATLPADQLARVHAGDTIELHHGDTAVTLSIARVGPAVNSSGLGTVEADSAATPFGMPSGSTVAATICLASRGDQLTVPVTAVVGRGSEAYVMVFHRPVRPGEAGRVQRMPVRVLQESASRAAVEGAISDGQLVIVGQTAVLSQLRDGDPALSVGDVGNGP